MKVKRKVKMWSSALDDKLAPIKVGFVHRIDKEKRQFTRTYYRVSAAGPVPIATITRTQVETNTSDQLREYVVLNYLLIASYYPQRELILLDVMAGKVIRPTITLADKQPRYKGRGDEYPIYHFPIVTFNNEVLVLTAPDKYTLWNPFRNTSQEIKEEGEILSAFDANNYVVGYDREIRYYGAMYNKYVWKVHGTSREIPYRIQKESDELPDDHHFYVSADKVVLHGNLYRWEEDKISDVLLDGVFDTYKGYILVPEKQRCEYLVPTADYEPDVLGQLCNYTTRVRNTEDLKKTVGKIDTGAIFLGQNRLLTLAPYGIYTLGSNTLQLVPHFKMRVIPRGEPIEEIGYLHFNKYSHIGLLDIYPNVLAKLILDYV